MITLTEVLCDVVLPRFFHGHCLHLTCREMYSKSLQSNLIRLFFSFHPLRCQSTVVLRECYPTIDSSIPHVSLQEICVLGRAFQSEELNDVCVVGKVSEVVDYFLSLLSVGISFQSLSVYPSKAFSYQHGRRQCLDLGYGRKINIGTTNVVYLLGDCATFIPQMICPPKARQNKAGKKAWDRR